MHTYTPGTTYHPGDVVLLNDKLYRKLDDGDNTPPDDVGGGWVLVPDERSNLQTYLPIETSLSSYEARRDAHVAKVAQDKASAEAKLEALGLTVDELKALWL